MKTRFFKIATIIALGAVSFLSSCDKEEIEEKTTESSQVNIKDSNKNDDFEAFIEELKNDTNVIEIASLSGKKIGGDELRSVRSIEHAPNGLVIVDAVVVSGKNTKGEVFYANGRRYERLDVDLNMGAGGAYQYLYVAFGYSLEGIVGINAFYNTNCKGWPNMIMDYTIDGRYDIMANVNLGTKGGCINLQKERGAGGLTDIAVVAYKHSANDIIFSFWGENGYGTYTKGASNMDLNKGAGGRYIYIFYK